MVGKMESWFIKDYAGLGRKEVLPVLKKAKKGLSREEAQHKWLVFSLSFFLKEVINENDANHLFPVFLLLWGLIYEDLKTYFLDYFRSWLLRVSYLISISTHHFPCVQTIFSRFVCRLLEGKSATDDDSRPPLILQRKGLQTSFLLIASRVFLDSSLTTK